MKIKNLIDKAKRKIVKGSLIGLTLLSPLNSGCDHSHEDFSHKRNPVTGYQIICNWKNYDSKNRLTEIRETYVDLRKDSITPVNDIKYYNSPDEVWKYHYKGRSKDAEKAELFFHPEEKNSPGIVWERDDNGEWKMVYRDLDHDGRNDLEDPSWIKFYDEMDMGK